MGCMSLGEQPRVLLGKVSVFRPGLIGIHDDGLLGGGIGPLPELSAPANLVRQQLGASIEAAARLNPGSQATAIRFLSEILLQVAFAEQVLSKPESQIFGRF